MNRAGKKNAFDESMFSTLENVTEQLRKDLPRIVIITGDLDKALDLEAETAAELIASGECMSGVAAFMEKKKPEFPD